MLFILQLRTNKVTIFYSAFLAEVLMNSLACIFGSLINYLLYKNLIDYLGILFFVIYGIFLMLWGFKKENETFEIEFEMIEELTKQKQRTRRTSTMILDDEDESDSIKEDKIEDKYNIASVNIINEKQYAPIIKKELTVIPEGDISREDSVASDNNTMLLSGKKQKNNEDDDNNEFLLRENNINNNTGFSLKLRKPKKRKTNEKKMNKDELNLNIPVYNSNNNNDEDNKIVQEGENKNEERKMKYKSRYYLDYFDKSVDTEKPNIDTNIFGTIFWTICLSEFGDRTQLISLTSASLFYFWGSLLGSCTALLCSCLLGVYFSKPIMKNIKQKFIDFILGILFLATGLEIYYFKLKSKPII